MAIVDITEYDRMATAGNGADVMAGQEPARSNQQVSITGGSIASAAFGDATRFVRVHADAACRIEFGNDPTANAASRRIAAGASEYFGVRANLKLAVITST